MTTGSSPSALTASMTRYISLLERPTPHASKRLASVITFSVSYSFGGSAASGSPVSGLIGGSGAEKSEAVVAACVSFSVGSSTGVSLTSRASFFVSTEYSKRSTGLSGFSCSSCWLFLGVERVGESVCVMLFVSVRCARRCLRIHAFSLSPFFRRLTPCGKPRAFTDSLLVHTR